MTEKNLKISVLSYFFISFVLGGLQRLSGLFVLELLQSVGENRQNAVMPFTLSLAVANIMGSFSRGLIEHKKSEYVILIGILLTATGAALCLLATNITSLIVFWGCLFGSGYGIAVPHLSRRLKNTSSHKLSFFLGSAQNMGVTVMPFILCVLTSNYGLQGSYIILSGIILNYLPLSIATSYNVALSLPNIKWRVRKRSSHYIVSKQDTEKIASIESFMSSLEPDLILKNTQNNEYQEEQQSESINSTPLTKEIFPISRKRSETRGNDLRGLPLNTTLSTMALEILKYEKRRKLLEGSFLNEEVYTCDGEKKESHTISKNNCETIICPKIAEKNHSNSVPRNILNFKNEILPSVPEIVINETTQRKKGEELEAKDFKNCSKEKNNTLSPNVIQSENDISQNHRKSNILFREEKKTEYKVLTKTQSENEVIMSPLTLKIETSKTEKDHVNESIRHFPLYRENELLKVPMDIKVHVEEYTFTTEGELWYENLNTNNGKESENNHRSHSNSVLPEMYVNADFNSQKFSNNFLKSSELHNSKVSNMYSVSVNSKSHVRQISENQISKDTKQNKSMAAILKIRVIFKFLNEIISPRCLCIILVTTIFQINIVTLLIMFADFGKDIDNDYSDFKWILVAFGVGGIFGKFCCCKISRNIPEKSHTIGVILFLLTGLSTAGVLFSTNLNWLAGFYGILGALEGGITYTIPKFIFEYIDQNMHSMMDSVQSFLSGIAMFSIPYAIGLSRDKLGDYEFLLQILSCSSILCAFLVYFLPYLSATSDKHLTTSSREKMETA